MRYLYIIGLIALIILLLSISNYTNLTIVMNAGRAREIGMRKVFGATQSQIAGQFLLEAIILSLLTLPVVLAALWFLLPHFNALMGTEISRGLITNPLLLLAFIGLTISIGLLAGGYPAFVLARTRVQGLFRGRMIRDSSGKLSTRKVIMTGQFILLIGLCSLTLFVNRQLNYIQDKDLGYRKENILYVPVRTDSSRFATFRNEVSKLPGIVSVGSGSRMGQNPYNQLTYQLKGTDQVFNDAYNLSLDYQAIGQLGVQTSVPQYVADPDQAPDPLILINETLTNRLKNRFQLTDAELIGRYLIQEPEYVDEESGEIGFPYPIAGTFADLHVFSLRESIDPMFLTVYRNPRYVYDASLQFEGLSRAELLAAVKQPYDALSFSQPFTPSFLSDNLDQLYQAEVRISVLSTCISIVAFLLALIGLVALTAYLTASKKKEIGIRLILGAGTADILKRFNLEYVPLLLTAAVITVPLAWWGINIWLKGFAYRIAIDGYVFAFAVVIVGVIASIAVSAITLRAARAVPADALGGNG